MKRERIALAYQRSSAIIAEDVELFAASAFDLLFRLTSDPVVILRDGRVLRANPAFAALMGDRQPTGRLVDMGLRGSEKLAEYLERIVRGEVGEAESVEARYRRPGETDPARTVRVAWRGASSGRVVHLIGRVMEDEESVPNGREPDPLLEIAARHLPISGATGSADELMRILGPGLGWEAAALWLHSSGGDDLRCAGFWGSGPLGSGDFAHATREIRFERGLGLIGRVWESRREEWLDDVTLLPDYVRIGPARRERLRTAYVLPIDEGFRCLGVLEFYSRSAPSRDAERIERIRRLAARLGRGLVSDG